MKEKPSNDDSRTKTAFIGVCTGVVAVLIMIAAVMTSNSVAVIADLFASTFEWIAILLSWMTLRRLTRKSTFTFDYGYGKLENLVSLVIAVIIFLSLGIVAFNAIGRFREPEAIQGFGVWLTLVAHILYLGINGVLCYRTHLSIKVEPSTLLEAQRRLFGMKAFCNICMTVTLIVGLAFSENHLAMYFDPAMSLLIGASMFICAYRIVGQNLGALLDHTLEENAQMVIVKELANVFDEYVALHGVRSRRSGNKVFVELFLEFGPERPMGEVQALINRIKEKLERKIPFSEVCIVPSTAKPYQGQ